MTMNSCAKGKTPSIRIATFGDSICLQYSRFLPDVLPNGYEFSPVIGVDEANRDLDTPQGANCGSSDRLLDRVLQYMQSDTHADWMVLNAGLHDMKRCQSTRERHTSESYYRANLQRLVIELRRYGQRFAWVRTTPIDDRIHRERSGSIIRCAADVEQYNAMADLIMLKSNVPLIDLHGFTLTLGKLPDLFCDHAHFTDSVRRCQAAFVADSIQRLQQAAYPPRLQETREQ